MIAIRQERIADISAREALLDASFGKGRDLKASARLRAGRVPVLSYVATEAGRLVGSVRLWDVSAGREPPALLLGPLAVDPAYRGRGIGAALVQHSLHEAERQGHAAVLLVGDAPYYGRFGFTCEKTGGLRMRGPYEQHRLLGLEFTPGALDGVGGLVHPTGRLVRQPRAPAAGKPLAPLRQRNLRAA